MSPPIRILLVEDAAVDAELVLRELRLAGLEFESRRVEERHEFLTALEEFHPDLVLSDYRLPRFDGLTALRLVLERRPALPVIIVTGSVNEDTAVECIKSGAADYVIKEHLARLVPAVRAALDRVGMAEERKKVDAERRRQDEKVRQLLRAVEQSPASIVITDAEGSIVYVNPRFEVVTGYSAAEALGRNPRILKSGEVAPEVYREMWERLTTGREWQGELLNRRKDGGLFWESASISPVRDEQGRTTHYVAVKEDITERKRAEEALRDAEQRLGQAQKMEAIGRLAGGVAHDFNNLLSVILGHAARLQHELGAGHAGQARIQQILWAAERSAGLTRQLLAFSRLQVLDPKVIRLDAVVGDARKMLDRVLGEDIDVAFVAPPDLGHVRADPGQIVQVFLNLAVNARDAMPQGGRLTIEFTDVDLDQDYASSHPPIEPGRYVMMAVSDTGVGMDVETRRRVFEPFFTTKPEGQGTGLGLATVYGIVKQSGGFIWVYSEPGAGTSFKIYLPRVDEPTVEAAGTKALDAVQPSHRGARVLVVEDDDGVRELMNDLLAAEGYRVTSAGHPQNALDRVRVDEPLDLLVTDVIMPGMSGRDLARRLKERRPEIHVLFVSGYAGEALARHGGIAKGEHFLQKPFSEKSLLQAVEKALAAPASEAAEPSA